MSKKHLRLLDALDTAGRTRLEDDLRARFAEVAPRSCEIVSRLLEDAEAAEMRIAALEVLSRR